MSYEYMSDREVEFLVWIAGDSEIKKYINNGKILISVKDSGDQHYEEVPRYCRNPSDAWPIIESIWDELMSPPYRGSGTKWERLMKEYNCGKLRAAMICLLKMKDE